MSHEIRCAKFESRINDLLDARKDPAEDQLLIRHAGNCAKCKIVFEDYLALDDSLSNIVWDAETLANMVSATAVSRPHTIWWSAALAAALLISFTIMFGSLNSNNDSTLNNLSGVATLQAPDSPPPQPENRQQNSDPAIAPPIAQQQLTPVSWNEISERLQPVLNPYYQISAELPGIRPIQSSLYLTIDWVQEKILKLSANREQKQGFGQYFRTNVPIA